jgi:hypothetical protein
MNNRQTTPLSPPRRTDLRFHIPPPPSDDGDALAGKVTENLLDEYRAARQNRLVRATKFNAARTACVQAIAREIPADTLAQFLAYSKAERESDFGVEQAGFDPKRKPLVDAARRAAREQSYVMMQRAGVDRQKVQNIYNDFGKQFKDIRAPIPAQTHPLIVTSAKHGPDVAQQVRGGGWFTKFSPFDGYSFWVDAQWSGGNLVAADSRIVVDNSPFPYITGEIGHYSQYDNYSASDFDYIDATFSASNGFWYMPPNAGTKDIFVLMRCNLAEGIIWLVDEWGWSNSASLMDSFVTLNVSGVAGGGAQVENWWFEIDGDPESNWYGQDAFSPGTTFWFHFSVTLPPAWVYISVSTLDSRTTWVNDVTTSQSMENIWVIEQVNIQV